MPRHAALTIKKESQMKLKKSIFTLCLFASSQLLYAGQAIEPIMVTIPAGTFAMGSLEKISTQPIHNVDIKQFSMGKYEVTVREFRQFVAATNYPAPTECRHEMNGWFLMASKGNWETNALNTSEFQPVVCINWRAADAYTKWLAKETGKPYRLPSEAEWEYAARAGTKSAYYFGDDPDNTQVCGYENTSDLSGENILQRDSNTSYYNWTGAIADCADHAAYASIVGMYKPNPFGLHDMVSNIREMLADCSIGNYNNTPTDGSAYVSDDCQYHATRGSSWHWSHSPLVYRSRIDETFAGGVDGFRLALDGHTEKLSTASSEFLAKLTFAQQQEHKRRMLIPKFPAPVSNVKLQQDNDSVQLTWDKSNESDVDSYRVYRNAISGGMFKLLASNLSQSNFTDSNVGPYIYDYTVVAVRQHMQSHYSEPVSTQVGWVKIPGKVEAEWATEFSDSIISFSSDERGGSVLTGEDGIADSAVISYQIEVLTAGLYQLEYRVSATRDTQGFDSYINNKKVGGNLVASTGDLHEWQTQQGITIALKKGKNLLTLKSKDNNWSLNWLALQKR